MTRPEPAEGGSMTKQFRRRWSGRLRGARPVRRRHDRPRRRRRLGRPLRRSREGGAGLPGARPTPGEACPHGPASGLTWRSPARGGASLQQACKPDSVVGDHPSLRRTRLLGGPRHRSLLRLAPDGVWRAGRVATTAGGLLPHRFTLTGVGFPRPAVSFLFHFPSAFAAWVAPASCPAVSGLSSSPGRRVGKSPRSPGLHDRW